MQNFNLHTHTWRCNHATGTDEEYVQAAIRSGLQVLGFSDHCPFQCLRDVKDRMNVELNQDYLDSIASLKEKYKDQITIYTGYEFEYFPELIEEIRQRREQSDYLILGNHYIVPGGTDLCDCADDATVLRYAERIAEAVHLGLADVVAHPDYFMMGRDNWSTACDQAAEIICQASSETGVPLEINLNGIRYGKLSYRTGWHYAYPWKKFWQIASQKHCKVVYGMDAHDPAQLDLMKERIEQVLQWIDIQDLQLIETFDPALFRKENKL